MLKKKRREILPVRHKEMLQSQRGKNGQAPAQEQPHRWNKKTREHLYGKREYGCSGTVASWAKYGLFNREQWWTESRPSPNSRAAVPTPKVSVCGDRAIKEVTKVK